MEENGKTWAERDIENSIEEHNDNPIRQQVLEKARLFKSGWVELAEALARTAKSREYEDWGYKTLEAYCLKELHIRKNTVAKLIGNYHFLKRKEPQLLEKKELTKLPDIDALNVLAKASDADIDEETYTKLKDGAVNRGFSAATIYKKMKDTREPTPEEQTTTLRKRIKTLAHSIRLLIAQEGDVPENVEQALKEIEEFTQE